MNPPIEAQGLIIIAYLIIILQFSIRWRTMQRLGTRGRVAVGLLIAIFGLRIATEIARIAGIYDSLQSLLYWGAVIVVWTFAIWNHAGTIADALSVTPAPRTDGERGQRD